MRVLTVLICLMAGGALAETNDVNVEQCSLLGDTVEAKICECAEKPTDSVQRLNCYDIIAEDVLTESFFVRAMAGRLLRFTGGREAMIEALEKE